MTKKQSFLEQMQERLGPITEKLAENIYVGAIGEGVMCLTPIILIGSIATLLNNTGIQAFTDFLISNHLDVVLTVLANMTMNALAVYACVSISYRLSKSFDIDPTSAIVLTLTAFLILNPSEGGTIITMTYLGGQGLFMSILCGLGVPKILKLFKDKKLYVKMPAGVPKYVENAFAAIFSGFAVCALAVLLYWLCSLSEYGSLPEIVYAYLQIPFNNMAGSLPGCLFIFIMSQMLFFCGIHGNALMSLLIPVFMVNGIENMQAIANGQEATHILNMGFMKYMAIGGSGSTLALTLLMILFAKSTRYKKLGRIAIIPQLGNINEPVLYGFPIVLNPMTLLPYIVTTIVNTLLAYGLTAVHILPVCNGISLASGVPAVITLWLNGVGIIGILVYVGLTLIDALLWYPFFKIADRQAHQAELDALEQAEGGN